MYIGVKSNSGYHILGDTRSDIKLLSYKAKDHWNYNWLCFCLCCCFKNTNIPFLLQYTKQQLFYGHVDITLKQNPVLRFVQLPI